MNKLFLRLYVLAVLMIFFLSAGYVSFRDPKPGIAKSEDTAGTSISETLPVVGSFTNLKALLAEIPQNQRSGNFYLRKEIRTINSDLAATGTVLQSAMESDKGIADGKAEKHKAYSKTNLQVEGVDESDIIKTDGKYLYQVNNKRIIIAEIFPAEKMKVVSSLDFSGTGFQPLEIYIDQQNLVLIGNNLVKTMSESSSSEKKLRRKAEMPSPPDQAKNTVKAVIYNISDKSNLKKIREAEIEGHYISSRKIGSALYLVANKFIDYYNITNQPAEAVTPAYRDSATKDSFVNVGCEDIRFFPKSPESNFLLIAGLDLELPEKEMVVQTYLGAGENIYASTENLYVAVTQYGDQSVRDIKSSKVQIPQINTEIYKFGLDKSRINFVGKGMVPGTILNQFSMDENEGFFRIATTKGNMWSVGENTSKNNVYILNKDLNITGSLEDIAPGERIYSTRFTGDRLYMVTFKQVDPLFVIDLSNPQKPKILGALKIPGYSDYLHPYDENHIIGFGKDTVEVPLEGSKSDNSLALYQGMKIAVFDVSDVTQPKEKFKEIVGGRGTDSELLRNHKALLFDRESNLLAFPVTIMTVNDNLDPHNYGQFTFQGAYVYNLDLTNGFQLKGKITHLSEEDTKKRRQYGFDSNKNIDRIIFIDDTLYTVSNHMIKASDKVTVKEKNNLVLTK